MKNAIKSISLLLVLILASCSADYNEERFENDPDSGWVEFSTTFTQAASGNVITIPVLQQSITNSEPTTITYSVEQVDAQGMDGQAPAEIIGTFELTIPEDELEGEIVLDIPPSTENYTVLITLQDTSQDNLIVGLEGSENEHPIVHTVKICDGAIQTSYTGSAFREGSLVTNFSATLIPVTGEENTYTINTAWGTDFVAKVTGDSSLEGQYVYSGTLTVNSDGTVTIVADDPASFPAGGTGTYDPCTNTFDYVLTQALFTDPFEVVVELVAD